MNKYQHIKTLIINGISVNVLDLVSRIVGKISELVDDISITACCHSTEARQQGEDIFFQEGA
jgi:hypothetical protein